ncbi:MAG: alpha-ketoglutarate-dependent dioxygenase AlkB [Myxococcales bacterium]|nr:alpha-ketoglutarate-dependent dioxygenase AlkB [Myxococcales bacterium]MBK7196055.1 alpha-ketoglutarate-dependent dioxygenase AlkB [Myxococcales bacterium]MBP6846181.1 alpha-ketoglutarate-dependent dioxygenase AlkB [Kofleriaceae bacterium]
MTPPPGRRWSGARDPSERALLYVPDYLTAPARAAIEAWLATLTPLWEQRYSTVRPPPAGKPQRPLLRPVYWLGNWQFACLGYYEPPRGVHDRCVAAEPFPPCLATIAADAEARVRARFAPGDVPRGWHLNTCLVNFYGDRRDGDRWVDAARVGDHRDFEPGPVVSLSLGERALFQFVARGQRTDHRPARAQWLDDGGLQAFGGRRWKDELLHRVQRVDHRRGLDLPPRIDGFRTRRVNFTFRFVPPEHVVPLARLGPVALADVRGYVETLAQTSPFFAAALATIRR